MMMMMMIQQHLCVPNSLFLMCQMFNLLLCSSRSEAEAPPIDMTWIETTSKKAALKVFVSLFATFLWL